MIFLLAWKFFLFDFIILILGKRTWGHYRINWIRILSFRISTFRSICIQFIFINIGWTLNAHFFFCFLRLNFILCFYLIHLIKLGFLLFLLYTYYFYDLFVFFFLFLQLNGFIFLENDLTVVSWQIIALIIILIFNVFIEIIQFIFDFFFSRAAVIAVVA